MVFSILKKELKRVEEKEKRENWIDKRMEKRGEPWQKMEGELKITLQQEINPENREKIQLEKEILKLREERKQISQEIDE
ncbi:10167_t:CDS:1, partial [Gigaspora margarita]